MRGRDLRLVIAGMVLAVALGALAWVMVASFTSEALAAGGKVESPNGVAPDRYAYYPGTEELGADEIRIVACGIGVTARVSSGDAA